MDALAATPVLALMVQTLPELPMTEKTTAKQIPTTN
jgi:hypothetical protein